MPISSEYKINITVPRMMRFNCCLLYETTCVGFDNLPLRHISFRAALLQLILCVHHILGLCCISTSPATSHWWINARDGSRFNKIDKFQERRRTPIKHEARAVFNIRCGKGSGLSEWRCKNWHWLTLIDVCKLDTWTSALIVWYFAVMALSVVIYVWSSYVFVVLDPCAALAILFVISLLCVLSV